MLTPLNKILYDLHALVDAENRGIKTDIVVRSITPFKIREMLVVGSSLLILLIESLLGFLISLAVELNDSLLTEIHISTDIDIKDAVIVSQNVICGTAYDDAGFTGLCDIFDHLTLNRPDIIVHRHAVHYSGSCLCFKPVREDTLTRSFLALRRYDFLGETGLLGNLLDNLLIVVLVTELLCKFLRNGSSAASELSADSDYLDRHRITSLEYLLQVFIFYNFSLHQIFKK